MTVLSDSYQSMLVNGALHEISIAARTWQDIAEEYLRPSVMHKPTLTRDGDEWCVLLGADLQTGVAGFGATPDAAFRDFDRAWGAA